MKSERIRHTVLLLLIAVLSVVCARKLYLDREQQKKYESLQESVAAVTETLPEGTRPHETQGASGETAPAVTDPDAERIIDFAALKERNPDVVAWVYVPDTPISYPVLWKENDNEYYLRRDIDRVSGSYDGIFLDGEDRPDFSCLQNLLYGHHMRNGSMFTAVCDFKDPAFFEAHRRVYLYTPEHTYTLRTLACLYTDSGAEKRRVRFTDRMEFDAYVDAMTRGCRYRDLPEEGIDRLFSLVTCSYEFNDARTILYCYEVSEDGTPVPPADPERKDA